MSNQVYFISDLHLGHKSILQFAGAYRQGTTVQEHDDWIISTWNSIVRKRDTVWVLGDIAFSIEALDRCKELLGYKKAILGNHDKFQIGCYLKYFRVYPGLIHHKGYWLSHAPIHPLELRGRGNIHGHVHHNIIPDSRYISACVEASAGVPRTLEQLEGGLDIHK